jgi:hypothetical protein
MAEPNGAFSGGPLVDRVICLGRLSSACSSATKIHNCNMREAENMMWVHSVGGPRNVTCAWQGSSEGNRG